MSKGSRPAEFTWLELSEETLLDDRVRFGAVAQQVQLNAVLRVLKHCEGQLMRGVQQTVRQENVSASPEEEAVSADATENS